MFLDRYEVEINQNSTIYEFISKGKKGEIKKMIRYSATNLKDFFNLGFGDLDEKTGKIDDTVVTDNGDSEKVLATVATSVYAFTANNLEAWVFIEGRGLGRKRLYRIAITKYLDIIEEDFVVFGLLDNAWQPFLKNQDYEAFAIKRHINDDDKKNK